MSDTQVVLNMYEDAVEAALGKFESEHVDKDLGDGRCGPEYVCDICYQYAPKLQNIPHRNSCPIRMLREALAAHRELEGKSHE